MYKYPHTLASESENTVKIQKAVMTGACRQNQPMATSVKISTINLWSTTMSQPSPAPAIPKAKQKKVARDIRAEALKIANRIKTEGQAPAETKAIANGIQRGMELFLRQQSEKTRDLDKRVKKVKQLSNRLGQTQPSAEVADSAEIQPQARLPWVLLALSWAVFIVAAVLTLRG
jgi:hypothetical protein